MDSEKDADFHINAEKLENPYLAWSVNIGGSIVSSPTVIDNAIVFGSNDTYIYAIDKNGEKIWSYKTGDMVWSSATVYDNIILIGSCDGYLYALSKNGELKWKFYSGNKIWSTPCIADGVVYFGSNCGAFYALSFEDGKELWRFHVPNQEFLYSASIFNDRLVFGTFSGYVYCLSIYGKLLWKFHFGEHAAKSPLVIDKNNNEISSLRKRSFSKIPKGYNCKVLIGCGDSYFRCLDAEDGKSLWKTFVNKIGGISPALYKNAVYFGSLDGRIYSLNVNGTIKWRFQTGNRVVSSPICENGILYVGSCDNNLYALKCDTGELLWRFLTDGEIISSPAINGDVLYFGSWDCHLYALSVKDKELLWKFRTSMGVPSYIKKPTLVAEENMPKIASVFTPTATIKGYQIEKSNYSLQTGELTNTFYGSPVAYGRKKSVYDTGTGQYKR